jgi:dephospho-CoA kinase
LTDLYLWVFKRWLEQKEIPGGWIPIIQRQLIRGNTDEISLDALAKRWTKYFEEIPELTEEQMQRGREIVAADEERRLKAIAHRQKPVDTPPNT